VIQKYDTLRYFIELSYFGKPFHGWQKQPNAVTVQQTIEEALSTLLRTKITIMGAGRTDTGVHASQMFAHVDIDDAIAATTIANLPHKLNSFLPPAIAIGQLYPVDPQAHSRFDATGRTYHYRVTLQKDPFLTHSAFYCKYTLDMAAMNEAANILMSYSDFECFSKSNTDVNTYICEVREAYWTQKGHELCFVISADRFLRNMVRAIVGTLLEIGQGKQPPEWMHTVIKAKNRAIAGASVPAHGLYLTAVDYPKSILKKS
jgi:tRNA pseudouridine38-40 synthase